MKTNVLLLRAITPIHVGTGQGEGTIDLPISRSSVTSIPNIPGSGLRGAMRAVCESNPELEQGAVEALFGPESIRAEQDTFAGALALGDFNLLVMPVRSVQGIYAMCTCPYLLNRFAEDHAALAAGSRLPASLLHDQLTALVAPESVNLAGSKLGLEELDLSAQPSPLAAAWATYLAGRVFRGVQDENLRNSLTEAFQQRFVILSDEDFVYLAQTATEVRSRVSIDSTTGTAKKGALWYEENLPAESILWGLVGVSHSRKRGSSFSDQALYAQLSALKLLMVGGKTGVGRGLCQLSWPDGAAHD